MGAVTGDFVPEPMGIAMRNLILIAALMAPGAAMAERPRDADARKSTQMVCRNIAETGSRLSKVRVCMTREQWAEQKRITRSDLSRAQTRRNEPSSN